MYQTVEISSFSNPVRKPKKKEDESESVFEERINQYRKDIQKPRRIDLIGQIFIDELRGIQNAQASKLLISEGRLRPRTVITGNLLKSKS